MKISTLLLLSFLFFANTCDNKNDIDDIKNIPVVTKADEQYKNVYQPLEGKWKGRFQIFEDQKLEKKDQQILNNISTKNIKRTSLKLVNEIEVEQNYTSETPYFQRVSIIDTYKNEEGVMQKVESEGINKVQNGAMWCVVRKPNETIIHKGSTEGKNTIIWQSNHHKPQKIEYFRETVEANIYEIVGYGYYEGDDPTLMPKLWFHGRYERQI